MERNDTFATIRTIKQQITLKCVIQVIWQEENVINLLKEDKF